MDKIDLASAFAGLRAGDGLATLARINDTEIKAGRFKGRFSFHVHADEDELFWVIAGAITVEFRDHAIRLEAGEMLVVPRGVEHRTASDEEAQVVVIHPRSTRVPPPRKSRNRTGPGGPVTPK
jgi:mannose-6-phosphate isomerase-like protein (cupin superfamily)